MTEQVDMDAMIAALRRGDGNGCRQPNEVMRAAADTLESTLAELRQERERADGLERNRSAWIADAHELANAAQAALSRAEETIEKVRDWRNDVYTPDNWPALDAILTEYDKQKEGAA